MDYWKKVASSDRWKIKSGRFNVGDIRYADGVYLWSANHGLKDAGVTDSLEKAEKLILDSAGLSKRIHDIELIKVP